MNVLEAFDLVAARHADEVIGHPPKVVFLELRRYLLSEAEQNGHQTKQHEIAGLLKIDSGKTGATIVLGPTFDKGTSEDGSFVFGSGGRLSFGLVLKERDGKSILESARFHYKSKTEQIMRYDVTPQARDLLHDPRAHYHWADDLRLPAPILHPRHILEVLFRVVDPQMK